MAKVLDVPYRIVGARAAMSAVHDDAGGPKMGQVMHCASVDFRWEVEILAALLVIGTDPKPARPHLAHAADRFCIANS